MLFCAVSITWIVSGLTSPAPPIAAMNAILLLINAWGVWQFLLNPKKRKVIERVEKVAEKIERDIEAEERQDANDHIRNAPHASVSTRTVSLASSASAGVAASGPPGVDYRDGDLGPCSPRRSRRAPGRQGARR